MLLSNLLNYSFLHYLQPACFLYLSFHICIKSYYLLHIATWRPFIAAVRILLGNSMNQLFKQQHSDSFSASIRLFPPQSYNSPVLYEYRIFIMDQLRCLSNSHSHHLVCTLLQRERFDKAKKILISHLDGNWQSYNLILTCD